MDFKHIMKQPNLGRKITELRKARGLTQEELVSKCNLNVRTLQRIESGEVAPRSYTVKTIFSALDYDLHLMQQPSLEKGPSTSRFSTWLGQFYAYSIDLFNLKTNTMKKISILTVVAFTMGLALVSVFSDTNAQSTQEVRKAIDENNEDFVRWFNEGKIDSLVTLYRDDACLTGRGCGKDVVSAYFQSQLMAGYKFVELTTTTFTVDKSVALEKGKFVLKFDNRELISGEYFTEWKLTGKEWRIVSDMANASSVPSEAWKN